MYDDLVKRLRAACMDCKLWDSIHCCIDGPCDGSISIEAADAIEELGVVVRTQKAVLDKFPRWIPVTERLP